jgi:hypothetical protein
MVEVFELTVDIEKIFTMAAMIDEVLYIGLSKNFSGSINEVVKKYKEAYGIE